MKDGWLYFCLVRWFLFKICTRSQWVYVNNWREYEESTEGQHLLPHYFFLRFAQNSVNAPIFVNGVYRACSVVSLSLPLRFISTRFACQAQSCSKHDYNLSNRPSYLVRTYFQSSFQMDQKITSLQSLSSRLGYLNYPRGLQSYTYPITLDDESPTFSTNELTSESVDTRECFIVLW